MPKYRKKPIVIEAITFDDFRMMDRQENLVNGQWWSFNYKGHAIGREDMCYLIPTLVGIARFAPGDMLITGVNGEIYPCKPDIFEATYDLVSEPLSGPSHKDDSYEAFKEHMLKSATDRGSGFVMPETALAMLYEAYLESNKGVEFLGLRSEQL